MFTDGHSRTREADVFFGPVADDWEFGRALADSRLLMRELRLGVSPVHLLEQRDSPAVFSLMMTAPPVFGQAFVSDGRGVVAVREGRALSAENLYAALRWVREKSAAGERLAALAPATEPGGPDRAYAVTFEGGSDLWRSQEARLYTLDFGSEELVWRPSWTRAVRRTRGSGGGELRWFGVTADRRWLEVVTGAPNSTWTCVAPPAPAPLVLVHGRGYTALAGGVFSQADTSDWNSDN